MGSQDVCLRWNSHQKDILTAFDQFLQNEAYVDVTIACEGQSLKAHKIVLSACSPYFQQLFIDNPCKHPIVILKDITYDEIKWIITYMYKGEVFVPPDQLESFLKTAETLKVKGFAKSGMSQNMSNQQSSRPVKRRKKSHSSSANATATALPNSNIAINHNSSASHRPSVAYSNFQIPGCSFHVTPAVLELIASNKDGESLPTVLEYNQEDNMIMDSTPKCSDMEPSTGDVSHEDSESLPDSEQVTALGFIEPDVQTVNGERLGEADDGVHDLAMESTLENTDV